MSGATVADMLADLLNAQPTPAKAANPAKTRASVDAAADSGACEGLRKAANQQPEPTPAEPASQNFAAFRCVPDAAQSEHWRGTSQLSQDSQGLGGTNETARPYRPTKGEADAAHAEPWDDATIARFVARVGLFLRRGISATDADDLAERLHLRDVDEDDRAMCLECRHLAGSSATRWQCRNARAAGIGADLPVAVVDRLQRCPGFASMVTTP